MSSEKRSKSPGQKPPKGSYDAVSGGSASGGSASSRPAKDTNRDANKDAKKSDPVVPPRQADVAEIARAVSTGFTVLILGGLLQPVVTRFVPFLGLIWLIVVAVVAFGYTGFRAGRAGPNPPLYGGGASVGAYILVLPVLFLVGTFDPTYAASTLAVGAVVGALAGLLSVRVSWFR